MKKRITDKPKITINPGTDKPKLILNPRIGRKEQFWPASRVADLLRKCQQDYGFELWIIAGSSDKDYIKEVVYQMRGEKLNTVNLSKLDTLGEQLKRSQLFIGADVGTSRLAVSLGVPSIIFFGATRPSGWMTEVDRNQVEVIYKEVPCYPCALPDPHDCPDKHCFTAISVEDIIDKVEKIINRDKGENIIEGGTRI